MKTILCQFRSSSRKYTYNTDAEVVPGNVIRAPQARASLLVHSVVPNGPFAYVDCYDGTLGNTTDGMKRPVAIVILDPVTIDPPDPAPLAFTSNDGALQSSPSPVEDVVVPLDSDPDAVPLSDSLEEACVASDSSVTDYND
jgi:hypothetical protein